ncbi:MAG: peroxiredoxin [Ignavibacteria bacterium]
MRHLFLAFLCGALALPVGAALTKGDHAPEFEAPASVGGRTFAFSLGEALRKGPVVVFFFPAAFTSECNVQAHEFAVSHEKFLAAGATVVGVSLDDIDHLNAFSADPDYCGGKVAVVSDRNGDIAKSYELKVMAAPPGSKDTHGAPIRHGLVESITFIIASDGNVAATLVGPSPSSNVSRALEIVQKLAPKQTATR